MSKGRSVIRYIAYIIEILVLYIINGTPNLIPEFFGGKPVLLVAVAITIAIFESEISAMVLGLLCGILLDFGISDTLGFYSVILPVICYIIGYICENVLEVNILNALFIGFLAVVTVISLQFVFAYILKGYGNVLNYFLNHIISRLCYTFVFVPILYFINLVLSRYLGDFYQ